MNDVTSSAVSSFSRQINCAYLPADGVQAALLPQFRGTAFPSFGQEAQVIALVEIQPLEAADLPHIAQRAVQPQASGPDPLDGDGPVPMITEEMGIPLAVFLNALPDGWDITAISQPVKPHRLFARDTPQGGVSRGGGGIQFIALFPEGFPQIVPVHTNLEGGVHRLPYRVVPGRPSVPFSEVDAPGVFPVEFWMVESWYSFYKSSDNWKNWW